MTKPIDYKKLLLQLIASLALCYDMGDVMNDVDEVLKKLSIDLSDDPADGEDNLYLKRTLHSMGIKTLNDTEIWDEELEEEWKEYLN